VSSFTYYAYWSFTYFWETGSCKPHNSSITYSGPCVVLLGHVMDNTVQRDNGHEMALVDLVQLLGLPKLPIKKSVDVLWPRQLENGRPCKGHIRELEKLCRSS
jgi:hypothetical protein